MNNRFDFTRREKDGKTVKCGYLNLSLRDDGKAELYFYGDIVSESWITQYYPDDKCPQDIADFIGQIDPGAELTVYFNSGGGDVFAGVAISNILKRHQGKRHGVVDGLAASIASAILLSCDDITVKAGAQVMIHKPWCYAGGNADAFKKVIERLDKCEESILDIYEGKLAPGVTREQIAAEMQAETWYSASQFAQRFKTVIEDAGEAAACAESDFFKKYTNLPNMLKGAPAPKAEREPKADTAKNRVEEILWDLDLFGIQ